jgi:hypothetical protein
MKRTLFVVAGALGAAALAVPALASVAGVSASLHVTSAEKTGVCTPAGQTYTVHTIVTVANGNTHPITVVKGDWSAKGNSSSQGAFTATATETSDGGLTGSTVPGKTTSTYRVDVTTTVPCDATSAQVCVDLTVLSGTTTGTTDPKCANFIASGKVVVPGGTIGLLGLTLVLGLGLVGAQFFTHRRRRRFEGVIDRS